MSTDLQTSTARPKKRGILPFVRPKRSDDRSPARFILRDENLRDFVENAVVGIHFVGGDGTILWANRAEMKLLGYEPHEYIGRNIAEFHADEPVIREILRRLTAGEKLFACPSRLRCKDGTLRDVVIDSDVHFDEHGNFLHTRCITRDVTDSKRLEEYRERLASIVASSDDAIIGKSLDGVIHSWNAGAERIFGYTADEIIGRPVTILIPDDRLEEERVILAQLRRGERIDHFETIRRRKDGSLLSVSLSVSPIRNGHGEIIGASKIARDITERRRTEEALRATQAQLAAELADTKLLQEISAQIIEAGRDGTLYDKIVEAVAAIMRSDFATMQIFEQGHGPRGALRLLASRGLTPEGEKAWEWVDYDTASTCGQGLRTGQRSIAPNVETCGYLAGTEGMTALLGAGIRAGQSTPLYSRDGKILGMMSSHWRQPRTPTERELRLLDILARQAADAIQRKRDEEKLRESEERFKAIVETTPECVKLVDRDGTLLLMNGIGLQMVGAAKEEELTGRSVYDLIAPEDRDMFRAFNERICDGEKGSLEFDIVGLKGQRSRVETHAAPLRRPDGSMVHLGITRDITERARMEAQLRDSESHLRELIDALPAAVYTTDTEGRITMFNRAAVEFAGREPVIGRDSWCVSWKLYWPDGTPLPLDECPMALAIKERKPMRGYEAIAERPDGTRVNFIPFPTPLFDGKGNFIGAVNMLVNITDRKLSEINLQRANEDLSHFAFAASHDLQEPLRMITAYSQLLLKSHPGEWGEEALLCKNYIEDGARRMRELLADLLAYTEVGGAEQINESVDLNGVFQKVLQTLKPAIDETGAVVTADDLPQIAGLPAHYFQLFQNLISNGIKYRGTSAPRIHITAQKRGGEWEFAVSDNGIGIAPEFHQKIFGVFKRLHGRTIRGTGIGLAICQRVVERHSGRIWVESEPGAGATFRFTLPGGAGA